MHITIVTGRSDRREAPCHLLVQTADGRYYIGRHTQVISRINRAAAAGIKIITEAVLHSKGVRPDPAGDFLPLAREKHRSAIAPHFYVLLLSR